MLGTPCSDGSACTIGDHCQGGACLPGTATSCDDQNPCTADTCLPWDGCVHPPADGTPCTDANACTVGDHCQAATCLPGTATSCDDKDACTIDTCDPAVGCLHGAIDVTATCDDQNGCTADSCVPSWGCLHLPVSGPCNDGKVCHIGEECILGACGLGSDVSCTDGVECSADICFEPVGCVHQKLNSLCDDGLQCTDDVCLPVGCENYYGYLGCSDGNPCTVGDTCKLLTCVAGPIDPCDDFNPCSLDTCDAKLGCQHENPPGLLGNCPDSCVSAGNAPVCFPDYAWWGQRPDTPTTLVAQADGTVYDTQTHLTWNPNPVPDLPTGSTFFIFQACDTMTLGGATNWRVPTPAEAQSAARLDADATGSVFSPWFQPAKAQWLLTSAKVVNDPWNYWLMSDLTGALSPQAVVKVTGWQTRCVH